MLANCDLIIRRMTPRVTTSQLEPGLIDCTFLPQQDDGDDDDGDDDDDDDNDDGDDGGNDNGDDDVLSTLPSNG